MILPNQVWRKYGEAARKLLTAGDGNGCAGSGKVICTTVAENEPLLVELFGAKSTKFQPSIPNLVYQYNLFTNYPSEVFAELNPEIPV